MVNIIQEKPLTVRGFQQSTTSQYTLYTDWSFVGPTVPISTHLHGWQLLTVSSHSKALYLAPEM